MRPEDHIIRPTSGVTVNAPLVQGLVIGDGNTVNMSFVRHEAFVAKEARPVSSFWVERADVVDQAAGVLTNGAVVALWGMAGSGKTSLAARIATELGSRFPDGCFWVDLAADDIDDALLRMALAFGRDISPLKSRDARAQAVRSIISGRAVLLVLDDAWQSTDFEAFLPLPPSCAALVTTRHDALAASIATDVVRVDELGAADAITLLSRISGTPPAEASLARVAEALGGLPLALELAGKLARQQARRPGFSWTAFASGFVEGTNRLSLGLAGTTVRAAFNETWAHALDPATQRAFALLGIFPPGEISTAEAAAAWNADDRTALASLGELIDLSLVRHVDAAMLRLHPLLADHAREMIAQIAPEDRTAAHCRVADHLFQIAPRPPRTVADMRVVLRSHYHAATAGDEERAGRVYPWFKDGETYFAVKAFLLDHGQHHTQVVHERLAFGMSGGYSAWSRSFAHFRLGEALHTAGELLEAEQRMREAVRLMESPEAEDGREIGLSKFLMGLGQVQARLGKLNDAEVAYRRAIDLDRAAAATGTIIGAHQGALIALLQLADLFDTLDDSGDGDRSNQLCRDVAAEAEQHGETFVQVMALARLARQVSQLYPEQALAIVRRCKHLFTLDPAALGGRQSARYARLLGETASNLAFNGEPAMDDALVLLALAIATAGRSDAFQELGVDLYTLGNVFEHYFLVGREPPLDAAWACYALSESYTKENEAGSPLNAQFRIDERIVARLDPAERAAVASRVAADPWGVVDAALAPHGLAWRPQG